MRDNVDEKWTMNNVHPDSIYRETIGNELQNKYRFHSTFDIINAAENNKLPDKIMITIHPQRWTDKPLPWLKELVWQNVKNVVKRVVVIGKGMKSRD